MATAHGSSSRTSALCRTLLIAAASLSLLDKLLPCHCAAAPAPVPAENDTLSGDASGLLIGGTIDPNQMKHGVVVIVRPDGKSATGVMIKPDWVLTAGHVVGEEHFGFWYPDPAVGARQTKVCQSTSGAIADRIKNAKNCVYADSFSFYPTGPADVALIGLVPDNYILNGSWGTGQTYPTPTPATGSYLFNLATKAPDSNQQVTLYGAGAGELDPSNPREGPGAGTVRSGIFNTIGTCQNYLCSYTTNLPCDQKNSINGDSGGPVFASDNTLVGIHKSGVCPTKDPADSTVSAFVPVASVLDWIKATANTQLCGDARTQMIGATPIGSTPLFQTSYEFQTYHCMLGTPEKVFIGFNSTVSSSLKEIITISDACSAQNKVPDCGLSIDGAQTHPLSCEKDASDLGSQFVFDVWEDHFLVGQHVGASANADGVCVGSQPETNGNPQFQTSDFLGGGVLVFWSPQ
ncbi:g3140 [Coccomyxa elongata]